MQPVGVAARLLRVDGQRVEQRGGAAGEHLALASPGSATDGPEISEEEHEVVLHEEEPVAEKRTVPKERVRLDTEVHTEEREASDTLRKEQIDVDDTQEAR